MQEEFNKSFFRIKYLITFKVLFFYMDIPYKFHSFSKIQNSFWRLYIYIKIDNHTSNSTIPNSLLINQYCNLSKLFTFIVTFNLSYKRIKRTNGKETVDERKQSHQEQIIKIVMKNKSLGRIKIMSKTKWIAKSRSSSLFSLLPFPFMLIHHAKAWRGEAWRNSESTSFPPRR